MTCLLLRGYNTLPNQELHRSLQVGSVALGHPQSCSLPVRSCLETDPGLLSEDLGVEDRHASYYQYGVDVCACVYTCM